MAQAGARPNLRVTTLGQSNPPGFGSCLASQRGVSPTSRAHEERLPVYPLPAKRGHLPGKNPLTRTVGHLLVPAPSRLPTGCACPLGHAFAFPGQGMRLGAGLPDRQGWPPVAISPHTEESGLVSRSPGCYLLSPSRSTMSRYLWISLSLR